MRTPERPDIADDRAAGWRRRSREAYLGDARGRAVRPHLRERRGARSAGRRTSSAPGAYLQVERAASTSSSPGRRRRAAARSSTSAGTGARSSSTPAARATGDFGRRDPLPVPLVDVRASTAGCGARRSCGAVSDDDLGARSRSAPVGVDTWGGFVFVDLAPAAASSRCAAQLGPIPERVRRYPLADLRRGRRVVYEVAANWKVLAENYNECYHCGPVHPELCDLVPGVPARRRCRLDWERRHPPPRRRVDVHHVRHDGPRAVPRPRRRRAGPAQGRAGLPQPAAEPARADHVAAFVLTAARAGAARRIVVRPAVPPDEIADPDFDPSDAVDLWDLVNRQDWAICESVQRGMSSRAFTARLVRADGGRQRRHHHLVPAGDARRRPEPRGRPVSERSERIIIAARSAHRCAIVAASSNVPHGTMVHQ